MESKTVEKRKQTIAIIVAGLGITFCIVAYLLNLFSDENDDTSNVSSSKPKYNKTVESIDDNNPPTEDTQNSNVVEENNRDKTNAKNTKEDLLQDEHDKQSSDYDNNYSINESVNYNNSNDYNSSQNKSSISNTDDMNNNSSSNVTEVQDDKPSSVGENTDDYTKRY